MNVVKNTKYISKNQTHIKSTLYYYKIVVNITNCLITIREESNLSRMFKEETGVNFIVYSNLSYFSTVFKKKIEMNPFEYRNNSNKNM